MSDAADFVERFTDRPVGRRRGDRADRPLHLGRARPPARQRCGARQAGAQPPRPLRRSPNAGIGLGGRDDDYELAGIEIGNRGEELDAMLTEIKELWASGKMGPKTDTLPSLIVGGGVDASFTRAAEFGDGWIAGGVPPEEFAGMVEKVKAAWAAAGRDGEPRMMGLAYSAAKDAETVKQYLAAYEDAGCDELILFPCSSDPDQVDRLADAVGL